MARILAAVCRSSANAQLLGDSHPAEVANLLVALSRPDALLSRGQTLMQLFAALAPVLWTTDDGAELWGRLRAVPVCDGYTQYLWKESLEPVTPGEEALTAPYVAATQAAAALCIIQIALSHGATAVETRQPAKETALMSVDCWAAKTLGAGDVGQLDGVAGLLVACLISFMPHRAVSPRQHRVLARLVSMLCIGLSRDPHTDLEQAVRGRFEEALGSVGMLMNDPLPYAAAHTA